MARVILPIANGFYISDSLPVSAQECVGWYPNIVQAPALSNAVLFGTPGSTQLATSGASVLQANRESHTLAGLPYFVNGGFLFRTDRTIAGDGSESFATVNLGVIEGTGRVSMADNGTQLFIMVPGGKGYIFTTGPDTLTEITDGDFTANGAPQHVVFINGAFVLTTDSKKFIKSADNNGLAYDALDFGTAEADPDNIVAPIVFKNQLFIGGSETIEAFQFIETADFPIIRTGLFIEKGIDSAFSIVNANDTFMFIGGGRNESPAIWSFQGNNVVKVSTTAIDSILQDLTDTELSATFSYAYAQKGAYFVAFALPNTTLVIDTINGRWHERKSQIISPQGVTSTVRGRINSLVTAYGRVLVGDSQDGRIGSLEPNTFTEYGGNILRRIATQPFQNNMKPFVVPSIELTMQSGVGNAAVPDPRIRMDRSVDGGRTYKLDRTRRIGKVGETRHRAIWRRNGRASQSEIFRWTLSDPIKPVIIQAIAEITSL